MSKAPSTPLISIITVCYNAAATIGATMRSVAAQTAGDYEHIVVDGASKDGTPDIARGLATERTRIQSSPDHGIYDAMNKGIGLSRGKYLIFLNAGDRFHSEDSLRQITDAITANGYPGVVYGQTVLVDGDGRYLGPRHLTAPENLSLSDFAGGMKVCHQAFVLPVYYAAVSQYNSKIRINNLYVSLLIHDLEPFLVIKINPCRVKKFCY